MTTAPSPKANRTALAIAFSFAVTVLAGTGCVNTRLNDAVKKATSSTSTTGTTSSGTTLAGDYHAIGNVMIAPAAGAAANAVPTTTIYFDPSKSKSADGSVTAPLISAHCSAANANGGTAKPCACQYSWNETNSNGASGTNQSYTRVVQTSVANVQPQLITCPAPDVYAAEIDNGITIKVTVMAASGNSDSFSASTFNYVKNTLNTVGSFQDAQGRSFDNIVHYSCYEQFKVGTAIQSKMTTETRQDQNGAGETKQAPSANKFCIQGAAGAGADCPNLPASTSNSAQAYYYNFFIRASQVGDTNQWNNRYTCPSVKEPIYNGGTVGSQGRLYPMDTNYALMMGPSAQFNIGVDAFVELANGGGDPVSRAAQKCDGTVPAGNASTDGFVQACLGYAAKPSADGTCPYIRDSAGAIRFTYRLRRFIALYPPLFSIDGKAPTTPQRTDTIYVLDRPVTPPTGADPLKPYTMRGPKPCPFALFDSKGVLKVADPLYANANNGYRPVYGATNNVGWNGTNVDGVQFPNRDSLNSCSAAFPLVKTDATNPDLSVFSIGTVNVNNPVLQNVYVRPIRSWAPHYEEDLSFQACAPQASPVREAPLHFAKDPTTGNVSYCAEVYPSQNDHVPALDYLNNPTAPLSAANPYIGKVRPYTSHVVKNSLSGQCVATIPATIPSGTGHYPAVSGSNTCSTGGAPTGLARHPADAYVDSRNIAANGSGTLSNQDVCANQTCDRTAIVNGGLSWQQFPLLATAPQVEAAISSDTTYGCVMTYDGGGPKTGKLTPSAGCCGANVKLKSGLFPSPGSPHELNTNAHLEPDAACLIPKY